jgi:hypothetical protein
MDGLWIHLYVKITVQDMKTFKLNLDLSGIILIEKIFQRQTCTNLNGPDRIIRSYLVEYSNFYKQFRKCETLQAKVYKSASRNARNSNKRPCLLIKHEVS